MIDRSKYTVVFMGTPEFAKKSLEALIDSLYNVKLVVTKPDAPSGRGMKLKTCETKQLALEKNIEVYSPDKLKGNIEAIDIISSIKPDFIVTAAYGKILPEEILNIPKFGCINVHGSLLPKYRGSAPVEHAIINGEEKTGITTMFMDKGMDTGDILLTREIKILEEDNLETVFERLGDIGAELLIETLDKVIQGKIERKKQDDSLATIAPMITREFTKIDFSKSYREIFNFVRGLSPTFGTYMELESGEKYKVFEVTKGDTSLRNISENIGEIAYMTKNSLGINCNDSIVEIVTIQPPNSKKMLVSAFLAGNKLKSDVKFI